MRGTLFFIHSGTPTPPHLICPVSRTKLALSFGYLLPAKGLAANDLWVPAGCPGQEAGGSRGVRCDDAHPGPASPLTRRLCQVRPLARHLRLTPKSPTTSSVASSALTMHPAEALPACIRHSAACGRCCLWPHAVAIKWHYGAYHALSSRPPCLEHHLQTSSSATLPRISGSADHMGTVLLTSCQTHAPSSVHVSLATGDACSSALL